MQANYSNESILIGIVFVGYELSSKIPPCSCQSRGAPILTLAADCNDIAVAQGSR